MSNVIKISFGPEGVEELLVIKSHVLIVLLDERSNLLADPLEFLNANTEPVHLL
jgi:hypothetical protein